MWFGECPPSHLRIPPLQVSFAEMRGKRLYLFVQRLALSMAGMLLVLHAIFPHHHEGSEEHISSPEDSSWVVLLQDLFDMDLGEEHLEHFISDGPQTLIPPILVQDACTVWALDLEAVSWMEPLDFPVVYPPDDRGIALLSPEALGFRGPPVDLS